MPRIGITAEQLNVKLSVIWNISHSTASRLGQRTHFNPPITSKVIHIQSLRDFFSLGIPRITHYSYFKHSYIVNIKIGKMLINFLKQKV